MYASKLWCSDFIFDIFDNYSSVLTFNVPEVAILNSSLKAPVAHRMSESSKRTWMMSVCLYYCQKTCLWYPLSQLLNVRPLYDRGTSDWLRPWAQIIRWQNWTGRLLSGRLAINFFYNMYGGVNEGHIDDKLTHWGRWKHICVGKLAIIGGRLWLVAWPAPSHCLNKCWDIVNWTLENKFSESLIEKFIYFRSRKCVWNCHQEIDGHFVSASMC